MRRRHRYIPFVLAGLFFGLATELHAEPPVKAPAARKAVPVAKKATESASTPPGKAGADLLLQMAYAAYEAGNTTLALEKLDAAEKVQPKMAECANLRGAIFLRASQFVKASEQFRRAVNLDPGLWVARFNVAEVPFRQRDFPAARRAFENLSFETDRYRLEREWELVQFKLIICSLLAGDAADAQKRFTRLRSNPASTAKIYAQAALAFAKNDNAAANKMLALGGTPGSPALKAIYADALVAAGWLNPPTAANTAYDPASGQRGGLRVRGLPVPLLPPALDIDLPRGSGPLAGESAAPIDEPTLTKTPPPESMSSPANAPSSKGEAAPAGSPAPKNSSEARRASAWRYAENTGGGSRWMRVANEAGDAYGAKIRDAQLRMKAKDFDGATQLLEEAAALAPNPAEALNLRGALEFYRGNYRLADTLFRKALAADPSSWPAKFNLAEIAFTEKDYPKARAQYEDMLPGTSVAKQPVERELLQYKIFLSLLLEGKAALAEGMLARMPLAGHTPVRNYSQIALEVSRKRFDKAAQTLVIAEQSYPASLNYIFAQPLEKLSMLPLPGEGASTAATPPPGPKGKPTPKDEAPVRGDLLPPPVEVMPPPAELNDSALARTEAQLLEEIVGGRAVASPAAPKSKPAASPAPVPAAVVATPTPVAAIGSAPAVANKGVAVPGAPRGWLVGALQWLFPGSDPTRLETLLFALGLVNLLGLLYLLASDVIARLLRPRSISIYTAGAVGVSVNRLRLIERLRIRLSVANMTRHSKTVGHMDTIVEAPDGTTRTFHWKTLCLNPSDSSSSFEEMDVFPLVLLPGEVASLYVDFVADGAETPTPWKRGKHQISVLGWNEAAAKRAKPDFKLSFPLEIPNIPWKNQDIVVDLAIVRPGRKQKVPSEFELLEWEDEEMDAVEAEAEGTLPLEAIPADPATSETIIPAESARERLVPASEISPAVASPPAPFVQPPPPRVIPPRPTPAIPPLEPLQPVASVQQESVAESFDPTPSFTPSTRAVPVAPASLPPPPSGQVRPVTPVLPPPTRVNPGAAGAGSRPPLSRTPFLSGPSKSTTTPQVLPTIGRPPSATPTRPVDPLVPMIKAIPRGTQTTSAPTTPTELKPIAPTSAIPPTPTVPPPASRLPRRPPEPPPPSPDL